jgi:hypothetical protein
MIEIFGSLITEKILPFAMDAWLRGSSVEQQGEALFRALKSEVNHNREMVRLCSTLDTYPENAELASSILETTVMDAILLNSGAHALVLRRLGSLQVLQETEGDNEGSSESVSADQLLIRVAGRIRAIKSIGRNAAKIPAARFRLNVRLRNIDQLLTALSGAIN